MRKFLFKPVNEILEKRQKEEDARLADAEAAKNSQQWIKTYGNVIKCHRERTLWYFVFLTSVTAADYTSVI